MSVDLLPRAVEREQLRDAGFEIWSGGLLTHWSASANLTLAQELSTIRSGVSSAKVTRTDDLFGSLSANEAVNLQRLAWYYVAAWAQASVSVSNNLRIRFVNTRTGDSWDAATQTWIAGAAGSIYATTGPTGFVKAGAWVPINAENSLGSDAYQMQLAGYFGSGNSLWYDDATIFGPFRRPIAQVGLDGVTHTWRPAPVSYS